MSVDIQIVVPAGQTQFDLGDPRLVMGVLYNIVVFAENSFGVGPPSNVIMYEGGECIASSALRQK